MHTYTLIDLVKDPYVYVIYVPLNVCYICSLNMKTYFNTSYLKNNIQFDGKTAQRDSK